MALGWSKDQITGYQREMILGNEWCVEKRKKKQEKIVKEKCGIRKAIILINS